MAACDPVTYHDITSEIFECLKSRLQDAGYTLQGTSGTISGPMGIVIDYDWDENSKTLYTHVRDKNFLVSCKRITDELEKAIGQCGGGMMA